MTALRGVVCLVVCSVASGCGPGSEHTLTVEERQAVADTVGRLFAQVPEATNALDFDRLLGFYRESDDLTYVARGQVTRSHESFAEIMDAQFGPVAGADLRWLDRYVDVLSHDVAVATATFEFTAMLENGDTARSNGTYMAAYSLRDGEWRIDHSTHTFPLDRR
jgi:uncharacterized protein (TIGR02246 family)